jgi:hypothetical protein
MQTKWLLCALLGTMALAQANPGAPAQPAQQAPATMLAAQPDVKPTDPVVTVTGYCPAKPAAKTAAGAAAKPAAKAPADCKTVVTRAQFEKLANGLAPTLTPQFKRQLANILPRLMVMSSKAEAQGLQNTSRFAETMKFARMQILTNELQRTLQEDSAKVSDADVKTYYDANAKTFETFNIDRVFIPLARQEAEEGGDADADADKDSKLTEDQQKAKLAAEQAKKKGEEDAMNKLAASLHDRAVAGEDFAKLQKEAYDAAGMKIESITVNIPTVRRTALPQAHTSVFDLKPGEISPIITDGGGHYIYRVNKKDQIPLDAAKPEIHNTLQSQKLKESMDKLNASFKSVLNDSYFGATPGGPMHGGPPMRLQHPVTPPGSVQPKPEPTPSTPGADPGAKPN